MTHPNQSFIDGFFRNNKPQGNNSYYYSKEFIEEQRKKKFNQFLKESTGLSKKQSSKHIDAVLNLFGYNTLSNNKNKQEYITEAKLTAKQLPQQFIYNGLLYTFSEQLNSFVNQHGHVIGIEQATAFMQMMLLEEVEVSEMDSATDGGYQRVPVEIPNINLFSFDEPRPQIGTEQPDWFRNSAFSLSVFLGYYWFVRLVAANLDNTAGVCYESVMLLGACGPNPQFDAGFTKPYNYSNPTGADVNWKIQYNPNDSYLRINTVGLTEEQRIMAAYELFVGPSGATGQVAAYKKYNPDIVWIDVQNAYGNPLIWKSNVVPVNGTTADCYSVIVKNYPNINWLKPLVDSFHGENMKCLAYFKPLFNYLNVIDYPPAKTINGAFTKYLTYSCFARSIFNENYKNYLKDLMVEVVSPYENGGLNMDGLQWDYNFILDDYIDFGKDALDVWAKSKGYLDSADPNYINWAFTQQNFPFPNLGLTQGVLRNNPDGTLKPWLNSYGNLEGTDLSDLINTPDNVITPIQKQNLIAYTNVLIERYNEIIQELTDAVTEASNGNAVFLPASQNSWYQRVDIGFDLPLSKYAHGLKTEFLNEPISYHRQRERNSFYSPSDYISNPCAGDPNGNPLIGVLEGTSASERVYADINRPDATFMLTLDQKSDYSGGNKTCFTWRDSSVPPIMGTGENNTITTYNNSYRPNPTGYPLTNNFLCGEDGIVGFLRGAYQLAIKNSNILDYSAFGFDGWRGEISISGSGDTAYYIKFGDRAQPKVPFWRKAAYHQKKIKQQMQQTNFSFTKRDMYAWLGIHLSNKGRQGIQSTSAYMGDFASKRKNPDGSTGEGLRYVKQCQMTDLFGINTDYSNGSYSYRNNSLNQNWGEFYWPIIGAMMTLETNFIPYCFIHDEHLNNLTELEGISVLLIPHKEWIDSEQQSTLQNFIENGGKIIYMEDIFTNNSYTKGDPRLKGRFYDLTDQPYEMAKLIAGITAVAGMPPLGGFVSKHEFSGMSFPFSNKYKTKQCSWSKYSDPDEDGNFTIGTHLLADLVWMDTRRYGSPDEMRFSELEPSSTPFRSFPVRGPTQSQNGIMDYDLFGFGPNWRQTFNAQAPGIYGGVTAPIPNPDGTTSGGIDKRYFYEPHPKNMWGNPLVGGYTAGSSGYWNAELHLNLGTGYQILDVKKIYVDQENEPNDIGRTQTLGFTYDIQNKQWKIDVQNIGMHAFVALKVKKLTI